MSVPRRVARRVLRPFRRGGETPQPSMRVIQDRVEEMSHAVQSLRDSAHGSAFMIDAAHNWAKAAYEIADDTRSRVSVGTDETARRLGGIEEEVRALAAGTTDFASMFLSRVAETQDRVEVAVRSLSDSQIQRLVGARLAELEAPVAQFLNYASAHNGPLSDASLWINHPVVLEWFERGVRINAVNERIVEQPFAFRALGRLPVGARILDVGGGESTVAFSLASLGYQVTVVEPQGYPFEHPNITVEHERVENLSAEQKFDGVLLLSSVEHFGIGSYQNPLGVRDDLLAMKHLRSLVTDDAILVLTTPFGPPEVNDLERIYDDDGIRELLTGWEIEEVRVAMRQTPTTWVHESEDLVAPPGDGRVVMVVARPGAESA